MGTVSDTNLGDAILVTNGRHLCHTRSLAERPALRSPLHEARLFAGQVYQFRTKV